MSDHPVSSWARLRVLHYKYGDICEASYSRYLLMSDVLLRQSLNDEEDEQLIREATTAGICAIVFAGMCFEAAIYDDAAIQLGDGFVKEHFEKLDLLSKWVVIPRLVCGTEIRKGYSPFQRLRRLIVDRNKLVHHKSEPLWPYDP